MHNQNYMNIYAYQIWSVYLNIKCKLVSRSILTLVQDFDIVGPKIWMYNLPIIFHPICVLCKIEWLVPLGIILNFCILERLKISIVMVQPCSIGVCCPGTGTATPTTPLPAAAEPSAAAPALRRISQQDGDRVVWSEDVCSQKMVIQ